jgi:DNA repair exonuclease SbcCD ATPase subunit
MNLELDYVKIWDLFRFPTEPQMIRFKPGETLILGDNQDSAGANSNGSGKSSIFDVICWVLTGKTIRNIGVDGVIRRGRPSGGASLYLIDRTSGEKATITRNRGIKETLSCIVSNPRLGEIDLTRRTTSQTESEIFRFLNLDQKRYLSDYTNTVYFSSSTVNGFASKETSNAERMQLITRFLSVEEYDLAAEKAKSLSKTGIVERSNIQSKIQAFLNILPSEFKDLKAYQENLEASLKEFHSSREGWVEQKVSLSTTLAELSKAALIKSQLELLMSKRLRIETDKEKLRQLKEKAISLESKVTDTEGLDSEFAVKNEALKEVQDTIQKYNRDLAVQANELLSLEKQLKSPLQCPCCNSYLTSISGKLSPLNVDELNTAKVAKVKIVSKYKEELMVLLQQQTETNKELDVIRKLERDNAAILGELKSTNRTIEQIEIEDSEKLDKEIETIKNSLSSDEDFLKRKKLTELALAEAEEQINLYNQEIGRYKETIRSVVQAQTYLSEANKDVVRLDKEIQDYLFWQEQFPLIKQVLIETYVPTFESYINYYLNLLNSGMTISISLDRELKSGKLKQEFGIIVRDEHGSEAEYESFSEGERKRIAVCIGFAIRRLASSLNNLPLFYMAFDEIVDGLDDTGIGEFFNLMKSLPGQKLIISHNDELKQLFDSIIIATRKNGITTVKTNYGTAA